MAQFPALPLWTDAYLADTGHLTDAEHGLYFQLLILLWRSPRCRIPNDDDWIGRRFPGRLPAIRAIICEFCQCDGNWVIQKKLAKEFSYLTVRRQKQSERAKSRWNKEKGVCRGSTASGNALSTPTPTPIEEGISSGRPLPIDWQPNSNHLMLADQLGLTQAQVAVAADEMRDWAHGNGRWRDNWNDYFRTWIRRTAKKGTGFNGNGRDKSLKEKYADALHKLGGGETSANVIGFLPKFDAD
jgi:uncharacterized protein YdaU (DUF1376 family)